MLFSETKPGMIVEISSGAKYLVINPKSESKNGIYIAGCLNTFEVYSMYLDTEVKHIGYLAIEIVPEFISVARY
jgi:hypothetical protein